jgi:hypothetical protein
VEPEAFEIGPCDPGLPQLRLPEVGAFERGPDEVRIGQIGLAESRPAEVGARQAGVRESGPDQRSVCEACADHASARQVGSVEIRPEQVGIPEICPSHPGSTKTRTLEIGFTERGVLEVRALQVLTRELQCSTALQHLTESFIAERACLHARPSHFRFAFPKPRPDSGPLRPHRRESFRSVPFRSYAGPGAAGQA